MRDYALVFRRVGVEDDLGTGYFCARAPCGTHGRSKMLEMTAKMSQLYTALECHTCLMVWRYLPMAMTYGQRKICREKEYSAAQYDAVYL